MTRYFGLSLLLLTASLTAAPVAAALAPVEVAPLQTRTTAEQRDGGDAEWCRDAERNYYGDGRRETFCEVRQFTLGAGSVTANTSNGSIRVTGERRNDILVRAMVVTHARDAARAREIAREITISQSGTIRADGPRSENREGWYVSLRIQAPESTNLDLTSSNGSLTASDVRGRLQLRTSNGSIRLVNTGGSVMADTSNGSVNATLTGTTWDGEGLDISTSNGSVRVGMPEHYNARLVAGTSNGSINVGFPITVQGRIGGRNRDIDTNLGSGGPTIRVRTSNGSVSVGRPGDFDRDRGRR